jgi:hypothetical protein
LELKKLMVSSMKRVVVLGGVPPETVEAIRHLMLRG